MMADPAIIGASWTIPASHHFPGPRSSRTSASFPGRMGAFGSILCTSVPRILPMAQILPVNGRPGLSRCARASSASSPGDRITPPWIKPELLGR